MKMNSSIGIFNQWLMGQIPRYIDNKISLKIGKIKDGKHGVSVIDAEIAADDHLVLKLSDGEIIDAGELPGVDSSKIQHIISTQLPNNQVYVSATAPSNPSVNDLWYDIS